jgi:hypothetical protein
MAAKWLFLTGRAIVAGSEHLLITQADILAAARYRLRKWSALQIEQGIPARLIRRHRIQLRSRPQSEAFKTCSMAPAYFVEGWSLRRSCAIHNW